MCALACTHYVHTRTHIAHFGFKTLCCASSAAAIACESAVAALLYRPQAATMSSPIGATPQQMARLQSAKHKPRQPDHPPPAYLLKSSNAIRQQRLSTEAITKTAVAAIDTDTDAGGAQPNHPRQRTGGQGQQSRRPTNWPRLTVTKAYQKFEDGTTFAPLPDDATDEDRRKRKRAFPIASPRRRLRSWNSPYVRTTV